MGTIGIVLNCLELLKSYKWIGLDWMESTCGAKNPCNLIHMIDILASIRYQFFFIQFMVSMLINLRAGGYI